MDNLTDIEVEEALLQIQRRKTALELRDLDHQERLILLRSAKRDNRAFIKSELTAAQFIDLTSDSEESMVKKENPPDQRLVKVDDTEEKPHLPESTPATRTTASTPTNERIERDNRSESQILPDTCLQQSVPEQEKGRTEPDPGSASDVQTVVPAAAERISEPDVQTDEPQTLSHRDRAAPAPTPTRAKRARKRKAPSQRDANSRPDPPAPSLAASPTPERQGPKVPPPTTNKKRQQENDEDTEYHPDTSAPDSTLKRPTTQRQQEIDDDAAALNGTFSQCIIGPSSRKRPRLPPDYYREDITLPEAEYQKLLSRYCYHALQDVLKSSAGGCTGGDNVDPNLVGAFNDAFNAAWTKLDRCNFSNIDKFVMHMMQIIHQMMPPTAPGPASQANTSSITRLARSRQILQRWYDDWNKCLMWCERNGKTEAERLRAVDQWVNDAEGKDST
ncbi:hypothetical protein LTS03_007504 [Exophiala xenobiotica]|nr:hypothetical protein LTS03_007504 [Exophiala xenobiotica]KAK5384325.1 hypothetical protein LTS13_002520 [Exophiala xenobiotica]KAK5411265.1 hypothetical protein LTR06_006157 [Exophiala xenobiotica]KAK5416557.1 hypothetical protein LTR90_005780 [Exophiala xenobiotica]KAK5479317.1 hypothetical protein LTR83_010406 [Exophiala xenobiotica]